MKASAQFLDDNKEVFTFIPLQAFLAFIFTLIWAVGYLGVWLLVDITAVESNGKWVKEFSVQDYL